MNYSDLPKAEVDRSQFIGNSHQLLRSFFGLTFPPRAGVLVPKTQIFFLDMYPYGFGTSFKSGNRKGGVPHLFAWFSLVALMVKTSPLLPENPGDSSYIQNLF
ncbi:hypothetical protein [Nostoc sp.]|uniref:hypothetical protein n=1 Tax=Nostoc sp. TaxID=1180 RepID=UPI002FFBABF6